MDIGWQVLALLACAALLAGWVDAVVGGGGLIQLPSLLIGLPADTPVPAISGTNKVSSAAGTLMAAQTYVRRVPIEWRSALPLVACAFVGSTLGARLVGFVSREWFTPLILVVVVGLGLYTWRRPSLGLVSRVAHTGGAHTGRIAAIGGGVGFYDGFVGPGTGTFFVIALVGVLGYEFLTASALTKLANLTTNVAA
ncbi:MAG TPA: TSUP family transporter, partial [Propionibacteriaceae bacterium]|nr:TSUP family transporter [Propionibacteriaceae bacterium]